jgi:acetate kinase
MELVIQAITDQGKGFFKSVDEISAVGHRVVHGGECYSSSVVIDDDV